MTTNNNETKDYNVSRYETTTVPKIRVSEYPRWKVKMVMFLEATDLEYLDMIYDGPFVPSKLVPETPGVPEHYIPKEKKDWTAEDKTSMIKDAKVRNLLHNSLANVISKRVIRCN